MKTFSINTLGCKVNQYESQQIRELLEKLGLQMAESPEQSDLVVINTCCVTHTASAKSRQNIRSARKHNPDAAVVVSGCLPTVDAGELDIDGQPQSDGIHLIRDRADLSGALTHITGPKAAPAVSQRAQVCPAKSIKPQNGDKIKNKKDLRELSALGALTCFRGQTRALLKVQDGCDGYCTYCIVPKARPFVRSKPLEQALAEAQALVKAGHNEIVVTGIFLGAYGMDSVRRKTWPGGRNDKLADLLDKMVNLPNMGRIRLSSLEPADVTERLLDTLSANSSIMPHLHLPLQSGSDSILRKMCRQYRVAQFRETVELLKSRLDRPAITTDIIVGFPGETDGDFQRTVELAKQVGFAKIHVFAYSPRKGTAAADMNGAVDHRTIKERSEVLHALSDELGFEYRSQFVGQTARVLLETGFPQPGGRAERYFTVAISDPQRDLKKNRIVEVKLQKNHEDRMSGYQVLSGPDNSIS
ncbi:MAG: tRNA (N(6)-L-threonylcarbamoyladenosine(37)-C(2))-methylthiotransferase MtaB [Phycisphaerales bacterium]|nr:MAG: tRNA (N(6)-L-threonylcarbamoyladenosine(37)-C(2))-methylthiotransferase MtaB [Phycisphaerales bacterium]